MSQHKVRNWMKYGPLAGLYTHIRRIKRRLRREPYHYIERFNPAPLSAETLREQVTLYPDIARLYYSLALAYLEPSLVQFSHGVLVAPSGADSGSAAGRVESSGAEWNALACLRCAETCKMEATERIQLYRALAEIRVGDTQNARRLVESLDPHELTVSESALREQILRDQTTVLHNEPGPSVRLWEEIEQAVCSIKLESLLVIGDDLAGSAGWSRDADYLLVSDNVTGLNLEGAAAIRRHFSAGVGTLAEQERARQVGIHCERWVTVPGSDGGKV